MHTLNGDEIEFCGEMKIYITISFSYAYLKGFERLMVSSPCVHIKVQRPRRAMSPLITRKLRACKEKKRD